MSSQNQQPKFFCEEQLQVRSTEGGPTIVQGYAALFGVRSRTLRSPRGKKFVEEIAPGAFDGCDFTDCQVRYAHSTMLSNYPNFEYGVDARGLWYRYQHDPADPNHAIALRGIERKDVRGSSFMFEEPSERDYDVTYEGDLPVRTLRKISLVLDMGPVPMPAYRQTTVFARSLDAEPDAIAEPGPELTPAQAEQDILLETRRREARYLLT